MSLKKPSPNLPKLKWVDHSHVLLSPKLPNLCVADPTVVPPLTSPDGQWHLFAHNVIGKINHYSSSNGLNWNLMSRLSVHLCFRPYIYLEGGTYYLFYEKATHIYKFPFYNSHLEVRCSTNLTDWSPPLLTLKPHLPWHTTTNLHLNLGNPCLVKFKSKYLLYYSTNLTKMPDYQLCEPTLIGLAQSNSILGPYTFHPNPIISLSKASAIRVFNYKSHLLGFQTHLFDIQAIQPSFSTDGINWSTHPHLSTILPTQPWKKDYVYVGHLVQHQNQLRYYYNGRDGSTLFSRESIGLSIADL